MINIPPYQWEILASMITYKHTSGLCLDFFRLRGEDISSIDQIAQIPSKDKLMSWGWSKKPVPSSLPALISYVSDVFPYKTIEQFAENEENVELFSKCYDWDQYLRNVKEPVDSYGSRIVKEIKMWAYQRVLALSKKEWTGIGFSGLHNQESSINKYAGEYKYFMPGQIPKEGFDKVYCNTLLLEQEGTCKLQNTHIKHIIEWYYGNAIIKDRNALQMIFFSEENLRKTGFEYVVSVKLNNYGAAVTHFAGITTGFDGNNNIYAYPILLTKDLTLTIESPFVVAYFEKCYEDFSKNAQRGRMECQDPQLLFDLEFRFGIK